MKQFQYLLIIVGYFLSLSAYPQVTSRDSLKMILKKEGNKHEKLKTVMQIVTHAMYESQDTVFKYVNYGLTLAEAENDIAIQFFVPELLKLKASALLVRRKLNESMLIYRMAVDAYNDVIRKSMEQSGYEEKSAYWSLQKGLASTNNNIGLIHFHTGDYDSAIHYYILATEISETIQDAPDEKLAIRARKDIATTKDNIALIYKDKDEFETSLKYSLQAEKLLRELDSEWELTGVLVNKGNILTRLNKMDQALKVFSEGFDLAKKIGAEYNKNMALHGMGFAYVESGQYQKAIPPLLESRSRWLMKNNLQMLMSCDINLATSYLELQQYDKAIETAELIPSYVDSLGILERSIHLNQFKQKFYSKLASELNQVEYYEIAMKGARQFQQLKDSLYTLEKDKQFNELQTVYETEKKQNLIKRQQQALSEEAKFRNVLIGAFVLLIIVIILVIRNTILKTKSLKEKEYLLREIHHRVKNNLQVISSLLNMQSREADDHKMQDVIKEGQSRVKAMSLIHQKLYQTDNLSEIDFQEYLQQLIEQLSTLYKRDNLQLEQTIHAENIRLDIDTAIPLGLILNELISNSFKYAFNEMDKGKLQISLERLSKEDLKLTVSDNGIGLPDNFDLSTARTLGLKLVNILTKQLKGTLNFSSDGITRFEVQFKDLRMSG